MNIVSLNVENVKRVSAAHIEPDGSLIVIGGRNGAGKTSVLDAISYALGGKGLCPKRPIRDGAEKAEITVDLGDLIVQRTFTGNGSYLSVKSANGFKAASPQAVLDSMVGRLTFDPLAFTTMSDTDREALLKELAGIDFTTLDQDRDEVFAERRDKNREMKALKAQLDGMPRHDDVPAEPIKVATLMDELQRREKINADNAAAREEVDALRARAKVLEEKRRSIAEQIADLEKQLSGVTEEYEALMSQGKEAARRVGELEDLNVSEIRTQIQDADSINEKVRSNRRRDELARLLDDATRESDAMTARLAEIDAERQAAIAAATLPIDGLDIDDDGVTYNGVPFDQISQAEKLRVSVAMGFAMNPDVKVMLIRDGSLLDDDNLRLIAEMAEENGGQVWIERVGDGPEVSVLIEDGSIREREGVTS